MSEVGGNVPVNNTMNVSLPPTKNVILKGEKKKKIFNTIIRRRGKSKSVTKS